MRFNKKAIIPSGITKELAEETGIHIGDGYLGFGKYKTNIAYAYSVTNGIDEEDYSLNYIAPLIYKLYGLLPSVYRGKDNAIYLHYKSKILFNFKKDLGLPVGPKDSVLIPIAILNSEYVLDCIRGIFDTDGSLNFQKKHKSYHYYPRLDIAAKNRELILQIDRVLKCLGFTTSLQLDTKKLTCAGTICTSSRIFLYGKRNLELWLKRIGFSNPKNLNKLKIWREKGYCEKPWEGIEPSTSTLPML
ncbi:MAG: LAGLIDADG family homing endonuclease, partial [Candidatus Diapherotrites archaeon]|nr:LAGLIDADG family homing endonuclease [Candidatus Diapherotrites archaeon]